MANIKGSSRDDMLTGTAVADRIQGLAGNDRIDGGGGDDKIEGGGGDDWLRGGAGSDLIDGGIGIDIADYGNASGPIRMTATGYSTDTNGKFRIEELNASGAAMSTDTTSYVENVAGTAFNDYLHGDGGANTLWGGAGDDWIHGGNGDDRLYGGDGNDLIDAGNGTDVIDGGAGIDTVYWAYGTLSRVIVDLAAGTISYPGYTHVDLISGIENIRGNWGTKEFYGNDVANIIVGSDGNDIIDGRGGNDTLVGDWGRLFGTGYSTTATLDDTIRGGDGDDLISGDYGSNHLTGGAGSDTFVVDVNATATTIADFGEGDRLALYGGLTIMGWTGQDSDGDGAADTQLATLSNGMTIRLLGHSSVPAGIADSTALTSHAENFSIPELTDWSMSGGWGGAAETISLSSSSMEVSIMGKPTSGGKIAIKGTRNSDTITVGETSVTVNGTARTYSAEQVAAGFLIKGDAGDDTITGGIGPDEIDGGGGNDTLIGGDGADRLLGGAGNDTLIGTMDDRFDGGRAIDTLDLSGSPVAVAVDLQGTGAFTPGTVVSDVDGDGFLDIAFGSDALTGVAIDLENIIGSSYNDFLVGNRLENIISGGDGNDVIWAGATADVVADKLFGGGGNDELYAGSGNDELTGGPGADKFMFDPVGSNGDWIVHDYSKVEGDKVYLFPTSETPQWSSTDYQGVPSLLASFADGDSITFVGITTVSDIDIAASTAWPGP